MFAYEMVERKINSLLESNDEEAFRKILFILEKFAQAQKIVNSLIPLEYEFIASIKGELELASLIEDLREFILKKLMLPILYEGWELEFEFSKLKEEYQNLAERLKKFIEERVPKEQTSLQTTVTRSKISLN
jgi:hypothetical protein